MNLLTASHNIASHVDPTIPLWGIITTGVAIVSFLITTYYMIKSNSARSKSNTKTLEALDCATQDELNKKFIEVKSFCDSLYETAKTKATGAELHKEIEDLERKMVSNIQDDKEQEKRINEIAQGLVKVETEVKNIYKRMKH